MQRLDTNIYYGSLTTLEDRKLLQSKNIKFIIGSDVPTIKLSEFYHMNHSEYLVVGLIRDSLINNDSFISAYQEGNTHSLQNLISQVIHSEIPGWSTSISCMTTIPTPPTSNTKDIARLHELIQRCHSNTFCVSGIDRFKFFNELIFLFKLANSLGNILLVSQSGFDEDLLTLLISIVLKGNPTVTIMDALQFIHSTRSLDCIQQDDQMLDMKLCWCSSLIGYHEFVRANDMNWGLVSQGGISLNKKPLKLSHKLTEHHVAPCPTPRSLTPSLEDQNKFKNKRSRPD